MQFRRRYDTSYIVSYLLTTSINNSVINNIQSTVGRTPTDRKIHNEVIYEYVNYCQIRQLTQQRETVAFFKLNLKSESELNLYQKHYILLMAVSDSKVNLIKSSIIHSQHVIVDDGSILPFWHWWHYQEEIQNKMNELFGIY